jgi:hypothetical protein
VHVSRFSALLERTNHNPDPVELACLLAEDRFWLRERDRLIGTHPDWPDAAHFLRLDEAIGHALVLALSRLPSETRREFAEVFYDEHAEEVWRAVPALSAIRVAAEVVLPVIEIAGDLVDERMADLLQAAAQGDDVTRTPAPAVAALRKAIARIRFDVELEDELTARGVVARGVAEVLDPSSELPDLKEVLARSTLGAADTWASSRLLGFLLGAQRAIASA